ncbi:MAG: carboxylate-amine ligase [Deltaproteobacteria bacterium RIFOXYA12_FULL_61_11]|nr:MAG: carboxylate-amine ligase [Deltaproteobacteria bacterium RIFOXYA12_FULL_61_11]
MYDVPLTLGVEEEYQIIDPETRRLTSYVQQMIDRGRVVLGDKVRPEFMQSQIEVGSKICNNVKEVREELAHLRRNVAAVAGEYGRVICAASTHPFSSWREQDISTGERYKILEENMQEVGRRLLVFGTHVHVGFGTEPPALDLLIDVMNQVRYFLPHLLALTTSSPFWHGRDTGLKSYRSIVFESLPRTGIPPVFTSFRDYREFVDLLGRTGFLGFREDGKVDHTKIWWDARPHQSYGTLEIRVTDMCTTIDEAVCVAALVQAIVAKLLRLRRENRSWRVYRSELIAENKWFAVRYGLDGRMLDFGRSSTVGLGELTLELLNDLAEEIDELGIRPEVEHVHVILARGTSADRQLAVFRAALEERATPREALFAVVDHLIAETMTGVAQEAGKADGGCVTAL